MRAQKTGSQSIWCFYHALCFLILVGWLSGVEWSGVEWIHPERTNNRYLRCIWIYGVPGIDRRFGWRSWVSATEEGPGESVEVHQSDAWRGWNVAFLGV